MKPRIQYLILLSCLVIPLMSKPSYSQSLTSITESDLQAMINGIDRATRKGSVAGIIAPFAPDIKIKMSVLNPGSDREVVASLNKDQFEFHTRRGIRRRIAYQSERKNMQIKIYDDQTAIVMSELYETLKIRQGTIRGSSSEVFFVSLRDGKLVITAIESRTRLY